MAQARLGCNSELILDEFGEKLLEELDYQQEARNIEASTNTACDKFKPVVHVLQSPYLGKALKARECHLFRMQQGWDALHRFAPDRSSLAVVRLSSTPNAGSGVRSSACRRTRPHLHNHVRPSDGMCRGSSAQDFGRNYAGDRKVKIPWVRRELCGSRILVMEWIDGLRCTDPRGIQSSGIDVDEFIRCGVISGLRQLLEVPSTDLDDPTVEHCCQLERRGLERRLSQGERLATLLISRHMSEQESTE